MLESLFIFATVRVLKGQCTPKKKLSSFVHPNAVQKHIFLLKFKRRDKCFSSFEFIQYNVVWLPTILDSEDRVLKVCSDIIAMNNEEFLFVVDLSL